MPAPGAPIRLIIKGLAEVTEDQVVFHNGILEPKEVTGHIDAQMAGVRDRWGGEVYAIGYVLPDKPLTLVYAPVNGGRILPAEGGETGRIEFQNADGDVLCWATQTDGGGLSYQTTLGGGNMSNIPRRAEGARAFHAVYSTRPKDAE